MSLSLDEAQRVIAELQRRQAIKEGLVDETFPKQQAFIEDQARLGAALCTRRAGKSEGAGRKLSKKAIGSPNTPVLYLNATRDECKYVIWEPILKPLNERLGLGGVPNETELSMRFPNGSYIRCFGVDAKPDEMKKVLGAKYGLVIIDEAAKYRIDLRKLVYEMLFPATSDLRGAIWLIGTPDDLTQGLFYDVTRQDGTDRERGWSVHEWSALDNPYMASQFREDIELLKLQKPGIEDTPSFKRMFLGKWVIDNSKLVYKYDRRRNYVERLPTGDYTWGLGVDLGFDDASAFTLGGYRDDSRDLYLLDCYKERGMDISAVATRINHYRSRYPLGPIVIDGANKQAVEEMRKRFSIPLIAADKHGKAEFIEIMNSEFLQGTIKLVGEESSVLEKEYLNLIWDEKKLPKKEEHPACENHQTDSALYLWRHCYQYLYAPVAKVRRTDEDKLQDWERKAEDKYSTGRRAEVPWWEKERA